MHACMHACRAAANLSVWIHALDTLSLYIPALLQAARCIKLEQQANVLQNFMEFRQYGRLHARYALLHDE
jgi:hypothetical protein